MHWQLSYVFSFESDSSRILLRLSFCGFRQVFLVRKLFAAIIMWSPVSMQPCPWTSPPLVTCSTYPPKKEHTQMILQKGVAYLLHVPPQHRGRKCDFTCRRYISFCKFAQIWNLTPFLYIFRIDSLRVIFWLYRWWCLVNSVWVLFGWFCEHCVRTVKCNVPSLPP